MDRFSPIAPAHIRVLVLPVGQFERSRFSKFLRRLRNEASVIKLKDVAPHVKHDGVTLAPTTSSPGSLLYSYHTSAPSEQQQLLSPFELFREPLLVLGVIGHSTDGDKEELAAAAQYIRERHPRVIHRCLVLLDDAPQVTDERSPNQVHIARADEDGDPSLSAAICQLSATFLAELSTYTSAMQASPTIQTPGLVIRRHQKNNSLGDAERRPASSQAAISGARPSTPTNGSDLKLETIASDSRATASFEHNRGSNIAANGLSRSSSQSSDPGHRHGRTSSQDRISLSYDKTKFRGKSRVGIVTGTLYIMAGQWSEALRTLVEHTTKARAFSDHLWHAKGLENILACLLLHVDASLDFQLPTICHQLGDKTSAPQQRFSVNLPSDFRPADLANQKPSTRLSNYIPDLLKHILHLYHLGENSLDLPLLIISEATLRICKLLAFLYLSNGNIGSSAFKTLMSVQSNLDFTPKLPPSSGVKTAIAEMLSNVQPHNPDDLSAAETIGVLAGTATIYGLLQMDRKKGAVMRNLILKLTDALAQARKRGAAEMGIHPSASLSADAGAATTLDVIREGPGIDEMVSEIAQLYGIRAQSFSDAELTLIAKTYGSESLKLAVLRDLIAFCDASPAPQGVMRLAVSMLNSATPNGSVDTGPDTPAATISANEQSRLATAIVRASGMSKYLGLSNTQATYWDHFLVRDVEFPAPTSDRAMINRSKPQAQTDTTTPGNPFLYDRNASRPGTSIEAQVYTLVKDEVSDCVVTLQNPCDISTTVESLSLVTDSLVLPTRHPAIVLRPLGLQKVTLSVLPEAAGEVKITACRVKISGCAERDFAIIRKPWAPSPEILMKETGLGAKVPSSDTLPGQQPPKPKTETISAVVLPAHPTLEFHDSSLVESSLMLLDGEIQSFSMVLHNPSAVTASIFEVLSTDEAVYLDPKSHAVDIGTSGIRMLQSPIVVQPHGNVTLQFQARGKSGMTDVQIAVSYSVYNDNAGYARVLSLPVGLTIKPAFKMQNLDVMLLSKSDSPGSEDMLLMSVDVGSTWSDSISYSLSIGQSEETTASPSTAEGTLNPGEVKRLQTAFSRSTLGVNYSDDVEGMKKALFNSLQLTWAAGARRGAADTSGLHLSENALALLRGSPVRINLQVLDFEGNSLKVGSFATIQVGIHSMPNQPIPGHLVVQLLPRSAYSSDSISDDRRLIVAGAPQRVISPITDSEGAKVDFAVCPLLSGSVELIAMVRPAQMSANVPASSWQANASLVMDVV